MHQGLAVQLGRLPAVGLALEELAEQRLPTQPDGALVGGTAAAFHGRVPRLGECRTRSRSCLDHVDQDVSAVARAHAAERSRSRPRSGAKAARRHGVQRPTPPRPPRTPQHGSRADQSGWLGSPSAARQRMLAGTARLPPWWRRTGSITRRSPTVHESAGSFIHRSPTTRWRRSTEGRDTKEATPRPRRAAAPSPGLGREPFAPRRAPTPFGSLQNL